MYLVIYSNRESEDKIKITVLTIEDYFKFFLQFYLDIFVKDAIDDIKVDFISQIYNDKRHVNLLSNLFKLIENKQYKEAHDLIYESNTNFVVPLDSDIDYHEIVEPFDFLPILVNDPVINPDYYKFLDNYFKIQVFK